jgi:tryptophan-rich sensory protein
MTAPPVERDERTTAIENAGYRWSYLFLSFGMLAIIAYRSFAHGQSSWDLFALLLLGGGVNATYQGLHQVLYRRWAVLSVVTLIVAALVGVVMVLLRR